MNSYQKRKQELEYYKQRCKNLEEVIKGILHGAGHDGTFDAYMILADIDLPRKPNETP